MTDSQRLMQLIKSRCSDLCSIKNFLGFSLIEKDIFKVKHGKYFFLSSKVVVEAVQVEADIISLPQHFKQSRKCSSTGQMLSRDFFLFLFHVIPAYFKPVLCAS